jgi:hypothetical protein
MIVGIFQEIQGSVLSFKRLEIFVGINLVQGGANRLLGEPNRTMEKNTQEKNK